MVLPTESDLTKPWLTSSRFRSMPPQQGAGRGVYMPDPTILLSGKKKRRCPKAPPSLLDVLRKIEGKYLRGRGGNSDVVDIPAGLVEAAVVVAEKPELQDNLLPEGGGGKLSRELRPLDRVESRDVHFDYVWPGQALGGVEAALVGCKAGSTMLKRDRDLSGLVPAEAGKAKGLRR